MEEEEEEEEEFVVWVRSVSAEDGACETVFVSPMPTAMLLAALEVLIVPILALLPRSPPPTQPHGAAVFRRFLLGRYDADTNTMGVLQNDLRGSGAAPLASNLTEGGTGRDGAGVQVGDKAASDGKDKGQEAGEGKVR